MCGHRSSDVMGDVPRISCLDHLVLTVADLGRTIAFYSDVLGCDERAFVGADGVARIALHFGGQKINLHQVGAEITPHAKCPMAGSADLCFLSDTPLEVWVDHVREKGAEPISGILARSGANGPIRSVYLRDPDGNLIEISNPA